MAVHIRHGAPGSYKTACAVWFDILQWLRDGRVVYTNIRGMLDVPDIEIELGETFPDTAQLFVVDTDSSQDRLAFAAWFQWLPVGAAICIDEGQFIYPDRRDFKPESLDYPGGQDAATAAGRPPDIYTAIDKHRHYNWDVCVTTPNIKKLPGWLRNVVESAYHHKAMDHIPFYGKRKARIHRHDPSTSGTTLNKQSQYELKRVPVKVHSLYGSTITGEVTKNRAETNPLKNPRFLGFIGLALLSISITFYLISKNTQDPEVSSSSGRVVDPGLSSNAMVVENAPGRPDRVVVQTSHAGLSAWREMRPMLPGAESLYIAGYWTTAQGTEYLYRIRADDGEQLVHLDYLEGAGFAVEVVDTCAHDVTHPSSSVVLRVLCEPRRPASREPSERAAGEASADVEFPVLSSITPVGYGQ